MRCVASSWFEQRRSLKTQLCPLQKATNWFIDRRPRGLIGSMAQLLTVSFCFVSKIYMSTLGQEVTRVIGPPKPLISHWDLTG